MAIVSRTINAYVMHGRTSGELLDYSDFFSWVASLGRKQTRLAVSRDLVFVIEGATQVESRWEFKLVSGNPEEIPLVYDERTGTTREEEPQVGQWRAVLSRMVVAPDERLIAVESRRAGVGSVTLERYFTNLAREGGYAPRLSLDLNPLPSPSFLDEIDNFDRIREAEIVVRRPNTDWDDADDILSGLADDSDGHKAAVTVTAGRGEELRRDRGIVDLIRGHVRRPLSNVNDVKVKGTQIDSRRERTVSLARHQLRATAAVDSAMRLSEEDETVFTAARDLLDRGSLIVAELGDLRPDEIG